MFKSRHGLVTIAALMGIIAGPLLAAPTWSARVGAGQTRMQWLAFDERADHYQLGVRADFTDWFGLAAGYLRTDLVAGSTLPPRRLSFFPYILTTKTESYRLGAVLTWKPFERVSFYAKPMMAYSRVDHIMTGGTAMPPNRAEWGWQTATAVRFVPAAGVSVYLGRLFSFELEAEKSRLWRLDSESFTAYLSYRF